MLLARFRLVSFAFVINMEEKTFQVDLGLINGTYNKPTP